MGDLVILMAEDNEGDVVLFQQAMRTSEVRADLRTASDGCEAMDYLRRRPPFEDVPRPGVIVLDLNLPLKSGQDVLKEIADDPVLQTIPVAILTTSEVDSHISEGYPGPCIYLTKTSDFRHLLDIVRQIVAHADVRNAQPR